jgi:CubicO group peptidase (beta-lactamase class C family)/D-alanyl-D-alanine dipeptidase
LTQPMSIRQDIHRNRPAVFASLMFCFALAFFAGGSAHAQTDYAAVKAKLTELIRHEMQTHELPAVYIALVDDQRQVWSEAFGLADRQQGTPASTSDVFRIASVSKLFTDIAVMQLAESGEIDIDAPVTQYLPDFRPRSRFKKDITLRQMMSHRSGLVREPPVGNYFDPTEPTLEQTIRSLHDTEVVYEPERRAKYSNAAIAVAGYVVEVLRGKPFARTVEETILRPLGMSESSFDPRPDLTGRMPRAILWSLDGRRMPVPTFQFGMAPAANMYSTLKDLSAALSVLFNGGEGRGGRIVSAATLEEMWRPQFVPSTQRTGIGLGFFVDELDGHRRISHGGDVYGFATEFAALPDAKLGVVVVNTMNAANARSERIATYALRLMLAAREGRDLPSIALTSDVDPALIERAAGRYGKGNVTVELLARGDKLVLDRTPLRTVVRILNDTLMVDDRISYGLKLVPLGDRLVVGTDTLDRLAQPPSSTIPKHWEGLIGEYGWDHNELYILEKHGRLHAMIEWYFSYPLEEISRDVYAFPNYGLYHGERLKFKRGQGSRATQVETASVVFKRRDAGFDSQTTFKVTPVRPVEELRKQAIAAHPPKEEGDFLVPELVDIAALDGTIRLDIRYATTDNFMGAVFYSEPRAFLQKPAAEAVARAHRWLKERGYGLLIHDAYRPWYVTKTFWDATPPHLRNFVADPARGSRHNRGCAVDVTLYDLATGKVVEMVSGYDEFTSRAFPDYPGGTSRQRWHRELLRTAMEREGFDVYEWEWWHFDFRGWQRYPIMNATFESLQ